MKDHLVSMLLAAVSPAGNVDDPAVIPGGTPLSAVSVVSAGSYTVRNTSINLLIQ